MLSISKIIQVELINWVLHSLGFSFIQGLQISKVSSLNEQRLSSAG